ncbi:uncharacterized protein LOC130670548 [Microplitis mediator]|uniref:uncharacterized protein LOC130670548 n=1 Tax=Microplitis mediator TaxID=375433 RepID=UPI0025571487|nr:uncharacterized protein LOC130670548 [Microplitis mediator]
MCPNRNFITTALFPPGKTLVYDYNGDVKAGVMESTPYASQYSIKGYFHITYHSSEPNIYIVALKNATTGRHNRKAAHFEKTSFYTPIPDTAKVIEDPFLIFLNESGELKGVKVSKHEPVWSKNMKFAWASMLQLNLANASFESPEKTQSYIASEKTIHGDCLTTYDINPMYPSFNETKTWVVTKFSSPIECSKFKIHILDYITTHKCEFPAERFTAMLFIVVSQKILNTVSRNVYEIRKGDDNNLVLAKFRCHGVTYYFLSHNEIDAFYMFTNSTFVLKKIVPSTEFSWTAANFDNVPFITDWSYQTLTTHYAENAAFDDTNGRHVVNQTALMTKIKQLLNDAANYLDESSIGVKEFNWQSSKSIINIREHLSYAKISSYEQIFAEIKNATTHYENLIKRLFLSLIPQVGTTTASVFTWNLIKNKNVTDVEALEMLAKLPFNIRYPSEKLLNQLEPMITGNETLSPQVHDPEYEMQFAYISAMKNVRVGKIYELLARLVRGDIRLPQYPNHIRLMAMWAIAESVSTKYNLVYELYWPIMSDYNLPINLRITAYEYLIKFAKSMTDVFRIHWFMVYEKSEHLYNFHFTTINGLANSFDPCNLKLKEYATEILRYTGVHEPVSYDLSANYMIETVDESGNGLRTKVSISRDERNRGSIIIYIKNVVIDGREEISNWAVYLHLGGMENLLNLFEGNTLRFTDTIQRTSVFDAIKKVTTAISSLKDFHMDLVLLYRGQAVFCSNYNYLSWFKLTSDMDKIMNAYDTPLNNSVLNDGNKIDSYHVFSNMVEHDLPNDLGIPIVFESQSSAVYALQAQKNQSIGSNNDTSPIESIIDPKVWFTYVDSVSTYNPIADAWHSVEKLSVFNANVSLVLNPNVNPVIEFLKHVYLRYWDMKLTGANIMMYNKNIVSIKDFNTNIPSSEISTYNNEKAVTEEINTINNSTEFNIPYNGLMYQITAFDCDSQFDVTIIEKWLKTSEFLENYDLSKFPMSPSIKDCGNAIKISPILQ